MSIEYENCVFSSEFAEEFHKYAQDYGGELRL